MNAGLCEDGRHPYRQGTGCAGGTGTAATARRTITIQSETGGVTRKRAFLVVYQQALPSRHAVSTEDDGMLALVRQNITGEPAGPQATGRFRPL